jgi:gas vesicle protein
MGHFSKKHIVGFFLTGAAVGAAVALLYAPKSGAQTRRDVRKFSKKAVEQLDDLQNRLREQLSEGYEQMIVVIDNVKEYVEEGKNKLQKLIRTA